MEKLFWLLIITVFLVRCGNDPSPVKPVNPVTPAPTPIPEKVVRVKIGTPGLAGMTYSWFPKDSLDNPEIAEPSASPKKTTTYTVTASSKCGQSSSNVVVRVYKVDEDGQLVEVTE